MPFGGLLTAGLIAAGTVGGALSNRSKTITQTPVEDPNYAPLLAALRQKALDRLNTGLPAGYVPQGLSTINANTNSAERALSNRLTGLGLSGSPVQAAGLNSLYTNRTAQQNQLQNVTAPLLEQQINSDNIKNATAVGSLQKVGTSETIPGNVAGGALGGLTSSLGFLMGQGLLGTTGAGGSVSQSSTNNYPILGNPNATSTAAPATTNSSTSLDPQTAAQLQALIAQFPALFKSASTTPGLPGYLPSLPTLGG